MKTKLLLLLAAILMIVACGKKSGTNTDPKQKEVTKDTVDSLKSGTNFVQMPTDDEFYEGMLKIFCKKNYQAKFKKQFKGLVLEDLVRNNDSTVLVSGPLIFSEMETGDTIVETEFKATIIRVGKDKYKITFENKGEKEWNDTTMTINYIQMNKNKAKPLP
ncbi:MAG: hypothetical protein J5548_01985 [Prevotella sp.]|nr:hypothetical protein [Prevotella sp.]